MVIYIVWRQLPFLHLLREFMSFHFHLTITLAKEEVEELWKELRSSYLTGCWGGAAFLQLHMQNKENLSFLELIELTH